MIYLIAVIIIITRRFQMLIVTHNQLSTRNVIAHQVLPLSVKLNSVPDYRFISLKTKVIRPKVTAIKNKQY